MKDHDTTAVVSAGLDQVGAMLREERHRLLRMMAASRKRDWHTNLDNLRVLLNYMVDQCGDRDEIQNVIRWVLEKPWAYRAEFVIAACRAADSG